MSHLRQTPPVMNMVSRKYVFYKLPILFVLNRKNFKNLTRKDIEAFRSFCNNIFSKFGESVSYNSHDRTHLPSLEILLDQGLVISRQIPTMSKIYDL